MTKVSKVTKVAKVAKVAEVSKVTEVMERPAILDMKWQNRFLTDKRGC